MTKQTVYTTTALGTVLLAFMVVALSLITVGLFIGANSVTAGGLALFGAVFVTAVITRPAEASTDCTGNPSGLADFEDFNDTHDWYEFGDNEWKCLECGLVIGWPDEEKRENMGVEL